MNIYSKRDNFRIEKFLVIYLFRIILSIVVSGFKFVCFRKEAEVMKILYMGLNMGGTYEGTNKIESILNPYFHINVTEVIFYGLFHYFKVFGYFNIF